MMEDTILLLTAAIIPAIVAVVMAYKAGGLTAALKTANEQIDKITKVIEDMNVNKNKIMGDEVRQFILNDYDNAAEREQVNKIIDENEANGIYEYIIRVGKRCYKIKNGQIAGSAVAL